MYYTHSKFNLNDIIMIFFINPVDVFLHLFYGTQKFKISIKSFCCWLLKENNIEVLQNMIPFRTVKHYRTICTYRMCCSIYAWHVTFYNIRGL